jgi:hypothetical protein
MTASLCSQNHEEIHWKLKIQFQTNEFPSPVATVGIFVPISWLPRTMLVLVARSVLVNNGDISLVTSLGSIDISGIFRMIIGETVEDLYDLLKGSKFDAMVEGGGEF